MKMHNKFSAALRALAIALVATLPVAVQAQAWPTKTVTLVIPFAAGGPTDVMGRTLSVALTKALGQSVVVENKVGAGGTIAAGYVAKAAPDGYTFFLHHNGMASSTALYRKLAFNPLTDFEYVSQVADVPMTLLARKDFPAATFPEMVAYIKANAAKINLANAGLGAVSHLCGMLFQQAIGVDLQTIPFQGTAPALNALLGSQVDVMCDQTTQTIPHIKAGSVKFYGVTTKQRIKALPRCTDIARAGFEGLRDGRLARHLRTQGHARRHRGEDERGVAHVTERPRSDAPLRRTRRGDRSRIEADTGGPADLAEERDRPPRAVDSRRRQVRGLSNRAARADQPLAARPRRSIIAFSVAKVSRANWV